MLSVMVDLLQHKYVFPELGMPGNLSKGACYLFTILKNSGDVPKVSVVALGQMIDDVAVQ